MLQQFNRLDSLVKKVKIKEIYYLIRYKSKLFSNKFIGYAND